MNNNFNIITASSLQEIMQLLLDEEIKNSKEAGRFLSKAPEGCICSDNRGPVPHFRQRIYSKEENGTSRITCDRFLSDKDSKLAVDLALKPFYTLLSKLSSRNIRAISRFQRTFVPDARLAAFNTLGKGLQSLVEPVAYKRKKWMESWMHADYERSTYVPENLTIQTRSGFYVRTKSEEKLADLFFEKGLTFRYEPKLIIGNLTRYPDFIILHPASTPDHMVFILWEHAGKMDDKEQYAPAALNKILLYASTGLVIGENIIYTFETKKTRLSTRNAEEEIAKVISMTQGSPIKQVGGHFETIADLECSE